MKSSHSIGNLVSQSGAVSQLVSPYGSQRQGACFHGGVPVPQSICSPRNIGEMEETPIAGPRTVLRSIGICGNPLPHWDTGTPTRNHLAPKHLRRPSGGFHNSAQLGHRDTP